jgi:hypothetical protein
VQINPRQISSESRYHPYTYLRRNKYPLDRYPWRADALQIHIKGYQISSRQMSKKSKYPPDRLLSRVDIL